MECAKRLIQQGHEVTVVTLDRDLYKKTHLSPYEEHQGIRIHRVPFLPGGLKPIPLFNPFWMAKLFAQHDVIHSHDIRFLLETEAFFKLILKKPLVIGTYGFIFHQKQNMAIKKLVFNAYMKPVFRLADRIHAISLQDQDKVKDSFGPETLKLITGGVTYSKYAAVTPRPVPGKLICFGRLDTHKGVDLLFRALAKVQAPFELSLIYGSANPEYFKTLKALAAELELEPKLRWLGFQSDTQLLEQLAEAHFALLPSRYEGFGLTTLEAMAAGAVPIASRIDAFENILTHGKDGFLVDYSDAEATARLIERCLSLDLAEARTLSQSARARAKEFDWDIRVGQLVEMYQSLIHPETRGTRSNASTL
jgi:alpha-1,3-mannosyltransferase